MRRLAGLDAAVRDGKKAGFLCAVVVEAFLDLDINRGMLDRLAGRFDDNRLEFRVPVRTEHRGFDHQADEARVATEGQGGGCDRSNAGRNRNTRAQIEFAEWYRAPPRFLPGAGRIWCAQHERALGVAVAVDRLEHGLRVDQRFAGVASRILERIDESEPGEARVGAFETHRREQRAKLRSGADGRPARVVAGLGIELDRLIFEEDRPIGLQGGPERVGVIAGHAKAGAERVVGISECVVDIGKVRREAVVAVVNRRRQGERTCETAKGIERGVKGRHRRPVAPTCQTQLERARAWKWPQMVPVALANPHPVAHGVARTIQRAVGNAPLGDFSIVEDVDEWLARVQPGLAERAGKRHHRTLAPTRHAHQRIAAGGVLA